MIKNDLKKYNKIIFTLFMLDLLFLIIGYYCISGIVKDIAIGLFISFIFYYIVVFIPEFLNKEAQKKVFLNFYEEFRRNIIRELLYLSEFEQSKRTEEKICELLNDVKKLNSFLLEKNKQNTDQLNYHTIMNNIWNPEHKGSFDIIVSYVDELRKEMIFLVSKVQIDDPDLLEWIRRMDRILSDGRFNKDIDWRIVNNEKYFIENLCELLIGRKNSDAVDFIKDKIKKL